jgi:hypothetical protein
MRIETSNATINYIMSEAIPRNVKQYPDNRYQSFLGDKRGTNPKRIRVRSEVEFSENCYVKF